MTLNSTLSERHLFGAKHRDSRRNNPCAGPTSQERQRILMASMMAALSSKQLGNATLHASRLGTLKASKSQGARLLRGNPSCTIEMRRRCQNATHPRGCLSWPRHEAPHRLASCWTPSPKTLRTMQLRTAAFTKQESATRPSSAVLHTCRQRLNTFRVWGGCRPQHRFACGFSQWVVKVYSCSLRPPSPPARSEAVLPPTDGFAVANEGKKPA